MSDLAERIERVRDQIADAAARAGRDPGTVTLIAVSKTQPAEAVAQAVALGIKHVGENRVQEAAEKLDRVQALLGPDSPGPIWHLIGTLQRNKCRQALDLFDTIHSVDSVRLAEALATRAEGRRVPILLELYLGDDPARPGFRPEQVAEALAPISALPALDVRGLMTVAPFGSDDDQTRQVFCRVRELRDQLQARYPALALTELSMGMTNDFALAIAEGATMIRVGRAIFGERG
jgi:pyridoxal phosphate enzyme (YggS family)